MLPSSAGAMRVTSSTMQASTSAALRALYTGPEFFVLHANMNWLAVLLHFLLHAPLATVCQRWVRFMPLPCSCTCSKPATLPAQCALTHLRCVLAGLSCSPQSSKLAFTLCSATIETSHLSSQLRPYPAHPLAQGLTLRG